MKDQLGFRSFEQTSPINQSLTVTYTPEESTSEYSYQVCNQTNCKDPVSLTGQAVISLEETGIYQITVTLTGEEGKPQSEKSGFYHIDKESPVIQGIDSVLKVKGEKDFHPLEGITAYDAQEGDLTSKVIVDSNAIHFSQGGTQNLTYLVMDTAGNTTTVNRQVEMERPGMAGILFIQSGIIIALLVFIILIYFYRRSVRLEKRIAPYTVQPLTDSNVSFFDQLTAFYQTILKRTRKHLSKSVFLEKYAKRYDKYVGVVSASHKTGLDFIVTKFYVALLFLVIAILSKTIQLQLLGIYEICFPLLIGFFVPDVICITKYKIHRNHIENDLLQAIIIMNNAFKSGRSITQAIELVSKELDGAIAEEFKKMHLELTFGLEIEVVFERFSSRINLEEVNYLTASLTILNKTGGNIIKVFSSIEKSLFNKKKLKLEMESLTGSSRIISKILFFVPLIFVIFISIVNPSYFVPLLTTTIGYILIGMMLVIYVIYIFFVRRIMKVRM